MPKNNNPQHNTFGVTATELVNLGIEHLPQQFVSGEHLIYSSPASLSFNSPGAEGFGVKRAALSIPGSVLLLISPGCCGRNTSGIGELPQYKNRFFFLNMDESDIITGRHLKKVPDAVEAVIAEYELRTGTKPSVVMICITCVDALLGTDMERVCRKAEDRVKLPVRPCYMYALTREGRKPPMVHVRQSLYSLLAPRKKRASSINILGHFAPLTDDCELYDIFRNMGIRQIREISRCRDYAEFQLMAEANFNVVLNSEARPAAAELEERLKIPYIELKRLYQIDKVRRQYEALAKALNADISIDNSFNAARTAIDDFKAQFADSPAPSFAVGEFMNGDPFELALSLIREGFNVPEIFGTISLENFIYIEKIAELSPETRVYSNLDPGIIHYNENAAPHIDFAIGKDAAYYHPDAVGLHWKDDIQPFGFAGIRKLYLELLEAYKARKASSDTEMTGVAISHSTGAPRQLNAVNADKNITACDYAKISEHKISGLRRFLPPFAPDASGAASVLYSLGGITVICDAGGCAGNICGFDEPRWLTEKSAIYSAGLRDMDAILGRDDRLVEKLKRAVESVGAENVSFTAVIGTPVPAVIATDYQALKRMCERKTGVRTLCVDTNGMELYDDGAEKAYMELFRSFLDDTAYSKSVDKRLHGLRAYTHGRVATWQPALYGNGKKGGSPDCSLQGRGLREHNSNVSCASSSNHGHYTDRLSLADKEKCDYSTETASCMPCISASNDNEYSAYIGILGATPLDTGLIEVRDFLIKALGTDNICCFGMGDGIDAIMQAGSMSKNIVIAPSALKLAEYLEHSFGIPYEVYYPGADMLLALSLGYDRYSSQGCSLNDRLSALGCAKNDRLSAQGCAKYDRQTAHGLALTYSADTVCHDSITKCTAELCNETEVCRHEDEFPENARNLFCGKRVLIIHQHVLALSLAKLIRDYGAANVETASWFKLVPHSDGISLHDEEDLTKLLVDFKPDIIISDNIIEPLARASGSNALIIDMPHFAVSGRMLGA